MCDLAEVSDDKMISRPWGKAGHRRVDFEVGFCDLNGRHPGAPGGRGALVGGSRIRSHVHPRRSGCGACSTCGQDDGHQEQSPQQKQTAVHGSLPETPCVLYSWRERPKRRNRNELLTTVTDERAIAAAAKMGAFSRKKGIIGERMAIGIKITL